MMATLLAFFSVVSAFEFQLSRLPSYGTPPKPMTNVAAAYNNETNEIFVFGGQNLETEQYSSTIFKFSLDTLVWDEVYCGSDLKPPGLMSAIVLMQSSTKLLVLFGNTFNEISSECYSFDFNILTWEIVKLKGDQIIGRVKSAYHEFEYNSTRYLALYGGTTFTGESSEIFFIDLKTLIVKKIEAIGTPKELTEATLVYFSGSLYLFRDYTLFQLNLESLVWTTTIIEANKSLVNSKSFAVDGSMYIFFGFSYFTSLMSNQILKLNLTDYTLTVAYTDTSIVLQASVQINSIVYLLFGQTYDYLNSILKYEFNEGIIKKTVIVKNEVYPSKRRNHASFQFDNELYIFGGISENGEYMNDVWKYNIVEAAWSKLEVDGTVPEARELMGYDTNPGFGLFIFGGRSSIIHSDFYSFNVKNKVWKIVKAVSAEPPARYSACVTSLDLRLVVIGGKNQYMVFSDVWVYDLLTNSYYEVKTNLPFVLINHKCSSIVIDSDTIHVFVMGGSDSKHYPSRIVYKLEIKGFTSLKFEVTTEILGTDSNLLSSESPMIATSENLMLISGSKIRNYVLSQLFSYNISSKKIDVEVLPSELALFGHTAVHIGKSIYIFGGGLSTFGTRLAGSATNQLYKLTWDELGCGKGSQSPNCKPCPKGYYENSHICVACPPVKPKNLEKAQ